MAANMSNPVGLAGLGVQTVEQAAEVGDVNKPSLIAAVPIVRCIFSSKSAISPSSLQSFLSKCQTAAELGLGIAISPSSAMTA